MARAQAEGFTHKGAVRAHNEDAFAINGGLSLFAVADGLGGHKAGEVASALALEAMERFVGHAVEREDITWPFGLRPGLSKAENTLVASLKVANQELWNAARRDPSKAGMATTIVALLLSGGQASIAHLGDSRAYRLRGRHIEQLTSDHSLVAEQLRSGTITAAEGAHHPMKNVVTKAAGTRAEVDPDIVSVEVAPGDRFLLCSDGLTNELSDEEIADVLEGTGDDLEQGAEALVRAAIAAGGRDNITVVLLAPAPPQS